MIESAIESTDCAVKSAYSMADSSTDSVKVGLWVRALRAVPTGLISRRLTPIVGRFPSADSRGFKILNMFDRASRPTITESVAESADSAVESADYWSRPTGNWPSGYGP